MLNPHFQFFTLHIAGPENSKASVYIALPWSNCFYLRFYPNLKYQTLCLGSMIFETIEFSTVRFETILFVSVSVQQDLKTYKVLCFSSVRFERLVFLCFSSIRFELIEFMFQFTEIWNKRVYVSVCPDLKYGLDCLQDCHCINDSVCDKVLGFCPNNICHPDWTSAGCNKRKYKFRVLHFVEQKLNM